MSHVFNVNYFSIQAGPADVRLIFSDLRPGVHIPGVLHESPTVGRIEGEAVMTLQNARALRDLLVKHVLGDNDFPPMETPNV